MAGGNRSQQVDCQYYTRGWEQEWDQEIRQLDIGHDIGC